MDEDNKKPETLSFYLSRYDRAYKSKDYEQALKILNTGLSTFPNSFELYAEKSTVYNRLKNREKAFQCLNKVLDILPNHIPTCFRLGRWEMEYGQYERAIEFLSIVIKSEEYYYLDAAFYFRAISFLNLKLYKKAMRDYFQLPDNYMLPGDMDNNILYKNITLGLEKMMSPKIIKFD